MKNILAKIRYYLPNILLVLVLVALLVGYASFTSHIDLFPVCFITIDRDITKGNRRTIKKAIAQIKITDPTDYAVLCTYVDGIKEKYCLLPEIPVRQGNEPGCYIRGSKVIVLKPESDETNAVIQQRKATILKYAQKSKDFWQDRRKQ